jgi:sugar O-acyltransferase (sialic acid O-acetyltransferase NeuD family)
MKDVAIIGYGVLGKQILNFLKEFNQINRVIVFDDYTQNEVSVDAVYPVKRYTEDGFKEFDFYIGIGYKHLAFRKELIFRLLELKRSIPSLVHPTCYVSPYANVGSGCLFFPKCNIDQTVNVGHGNIFHNSVTISHDCMIADCNYFSPSVVLCGDIIVGSETFVGAGSIISNGLKIGDNAIIGIGSCITQNIEPHSSIIGNPQKTLKNKLKLL